MIRPLFLQRISGRVARKVHHINREPVRPLSDADHQHVDHFYGFLAGLGMAGIVAAVLVAFIGRTVCA